MGSTPIQPTSEKAPPTPPTGDASPRATPDPERLREELLGLGFTLVGFTNPVPPAAASAALTEWLARGWAGEMARWLGRNAAVRRDPRHRFPWARTAVVFALAYDRPEPRSGLVARISRYAAGRDYHNLLRRRLRRARRILLAHGARHWRAWTDTGPVLEKALAAAAGLGWIGRHTLLVHPHWGSYLFLAVGLTDLELPWDPPATDHCGSCRACVMACPTEALTADGRLDARRCISYLTIEHRGAFVGPYAAEWFGWLHGCDICQEACPFVHGARRRGRWGEAAFAPHSAWSQLSLEELARLPDASWSQLTLGSSLRRGGSERLRRNARRLLVTGGGT